MAGHGDKAIVSSVAANTFMAVIKFVAFFIGGGAGMFSEAIHSLGDGVNSLLLLVGKKTSRRAATRLHPFGYGKRVNLACVIAGIGLIAGAYAAISHGYHQFLEPEATGGLWTSRVVLLVGFVIDGYVLWTAMKTIAQESGVRGNTFVMAFSNFKKASATTRFVFFEDLVATSGVVIAAIGLELSHFLGDYRIDGIAGILIGLMLVGIAINIIRENVTTLLGKAASKEIHVKIGNLVLALPEVRDIKDIDVIENGDFFKVYMEVEANPEMPLKLADDIIHLAEATIRKEIPQVCYVSIEVMADDNIKDWEHAQASS